jgi:hypothetical protein
MRMSLEGRLLVLATTPPLLQPGLPLEQIATTLQASVSHGLHREVGYAFEQMVAVAQESKGGRYVVLGE